MPSLCCCGTERRQNQTPETELAGVRETAPPHCQSYIRSPRIKSKGKAIARNSAQMICYRHETESLAVPVPGPTDLDQLVVEDSEHEESDTVHHPRSITIYNKLRSRIRRPFTREKNVKRNTPVTISKSAEEIARRAELRRLRCLRIQAELKREEDQNKINSGSPKSARNISSLASLSQPGGGPRDTLEFVVPRSLKYQNSTQSALFNTSKDEFTSGDKQAANGLEKKDHSDSTLGREPPQRGDVIQFLDPRDNPASKASQHQPEQTPSLPTSEPLNCSALSPQPENQCSAAEDQEQKRAEKISWDGQSALGIWIIAQSLSSQDCSAANLDITTGNGNPPRGKSVVPANDSQNSQKPIQTKKSNEGSLPVDPMTANKDDVSARKNEMAGDHLHVHLEASSSTDLLQSPSQDLAEKYALAMAYSDTTKTLLENSSSNYTSGITSFQASPARSETHLPSLAVEELQHLQLCPFPAEDQHPKLCAYERSEEPRPHTKPINTFTRMEETKSECIDSISHGTAEEVPFRHSSLCQRELELESIQKRFGDVMYQKKIPVPRNSRFKEDFDKRNKPKETRGSLLNRIHLTIPGRSKEDTESRSSIDTNFLSPNDPRLSNRHRLQGSADTRSNGHSKASSSIYLRPEHDESATDLWGRAIRLEAEQRRSTSRNSGLQKSDYSLYPVRAQTNQASRSSYHGTIERSGLTPPENERPKTPSKSEIHFPMPVINSILSPLNEKSQKQKASTDLWTRFPSHTRQERSHLADTRDLVNPRDFAIRIVSDDGQVRWSTDKPPRSLTDGVSLRSTTLPSKLGKVVKSGISKIFHTKDQPPKFEPAFREGFSNDPRVIAEIEFTELEALAERAEQKANRASKSDNLDTDRSGTSDISDHGLPGEATRLSQTDGAATSFSPYDPQARTPSPGDVSDERHNTSKSDIFHTPFSSNIALNAQIGSLKRQSMPAIKSSSTMDLRRPRQKLTYLRPKSFAFPEKYLSSRPSLPNFSSV